MWSNPSSAARILPRTASSRIWPLEVIPTVRCRWSRDRSRLTSPRETNSSRCRPSRVGSRRVRRDSSTRDIAVLDAPSTKIAHSHVDSTARIRSCLESAGNVPSSLVTRA